MNSGIVERKNRFSAVGSPRSRCDPVLHVILKAHRVDRALRQGPRNDRASGDRWWAEKNRRGSGESFLNRGVGRWWLILRAWRCPSYRQKKTVIGRETVGLAGRRGRSLLRVSVSGRFVELEPALVHGHPELLGIVRN